MPSGTDCQALARLRYEEAEILYKNQKYEGAYYLAGYAAEMALKAAICKRLTIDIYDSTIVREEIARPFMIHKLDWLLIFSGLQLQMTTDKAIDGDLDKAWSRVTQWKEDRRYEPPGREQPTCLAFLKSINTFLTWVQNHW